MPILSTELLSNYYAIVLNGKKYILDSWNENLQQDVNDKSFIQGDIANRIIEVSNPLHQATMSGPILLLKDLDAELKVVDNAFINVEEANKNLPPFGIYDIFDLIIEIFLSTEQGNFLPYIPFLSPLLERDNLFFQDELITLPLRASDLFFLVC